MSFRDLCSELARNDVSNANDKNPFVGKLTSNNGSIYIGRSIEDPNKDKQFQPRSFKEEWTLVSDEGLYVMPEDIANKDETYYSLLEQGWRLPTHLELATIYSLRNVHDMEGTFKTERSSREHWTKTTYLTSESPLHDYWQLGLDFSGLNEYSFEQRKCTDDEIDKVNVRLITSGPPM